MTVLRAFPLLLALGSMLAPPALAQMPGDPRPRYSHAPTRGAQYTFQRGARVQRGTPSASDGSAPVTHREPRASKGLKSSLKSPQDALALSGCASLDGQRPRHVEQMLGNAGFQRRVAETPVALAYLHSLPPRMFLVESSNGQSQYAYADPTGCQCFYVGTESQYQALRKVQRNEAAVADQLRDIERHRALRELWRGPTPPLQ